jgi:universal stress protein E
MKMNNRPWKTLLVVIADPFASEQPAFAKAVALAIRSGARLVLFNSFMIPQPVNDMPMGSRSQIIASAVRERRERLELLLANSRVNGAKCIVAWDYPTHEAIVRQVLKINPDLLITSSHRHGKVARWLLANTDWELIRQCPCPVWFVRSPEMPLDPNILVAVDPFHAHDKPAILDERLVHAARMVGEQFGGHVTLVHACSVPDEARAVRLLMLAQAKQAVQDLAARHGVDAEHCEVKVGGAEDIISSIERRDSADLLVMGAVSRSIDTHPVIGSTAERVIDRVACDLLVLKPAGINAVRRERPPRPAVLRQSMTKRRGKRPPVHYAG